MKNSDAVLPKRVHHVGGRRRMRTAPILRREQGVARPATELRFCRHR